jgi:hypothetical protein
MRLLFDLDLRVPKIINKPVNKYTWTKVGKVREMNKVNSDLDFNKKIQISAVKAI